MAISPNHYRWNDFVGHLVEAGLPEEAEKLKALDQAADKALRARAEAAQESLRINLDRISPLLRHCHKKQGRSLELYTWKI